MERIFAACSIGASVLVLQLSIGLNTGLYPGVTDAASELEIVFLTMEEKIPAARSNLDPFIHNKGIPGAELGIADNNTTGRFTGQNFVLRVVEVKDSDSVVTAYQNLVKQGSHLFVTRLPGASIRRMAEFSESKQSLILDSSTSDDALRIELCHPEILFLRPSRAMKTDALAQYLLQKRWRKLFLLIGPNAEDALYTEALRRSAKRYGMTIVEERDWQSNHDPHRTAQSEIPVMTQNDDYDVVVVADEQDLFGEYLAYRTWLARPVIGTQGLIATAWDPNHEQWGAEQLQNRFRETAARSMTEQDYTAWLAVRVIGEAATRTGKADSESLKAYIRSDEFSVAGFKGTKLSFRFWDGQLRQPILLAAPRSVVGVAPLEGFLHPKNELDSLGYD
ncbi:MAG: ABC transporter substrate-binding protein, partial [Methylococcales bacterium]